MDATKLEKLLISEVSGVDDPANEVPGWMIAKAAEAAGAASATESVVVPVESAPLDAPTIVEKIKSLLFPTERKDDVEMTTEELNGVLDERFAALTETLGESLAKSLAPPVEGAGEVAAVIDPASATEAVAVVVEEPVPGITAEDVSKAIEEAFAPYHEIFEKTLDRVERIEQALATGARQSLDGQEDGGTTKPDAPTTSTLTDAIGKALKGETVVLS